MSSHGQLGERLKSRIEDEQNLIVELMREQRAKLAKSLRKQSNDVLNTMQNDILPLKRLVLIKWLQALSIGLAIFMGISLGSWGLTQFLAHRITSQLEQIQDMERNLELMRQQGGDIRFNLCDGRICARLDETAPVYTEGYRILR